MGKIVGSTWVSYVCYDDGVAFVALKYLLVASLPNLRRLSSKDGEKRFPCLSTLEIEDCGKFSLEGLQSLKKLEMKWCAVKVWAGLKCLTCIENLTIQKCEEVEGLQHMTALKNLTLESLPNIEFLLQQLRFEDLPWLSRLFIVDCDKLMSLPTSLSLSNLENLSIINCNPELKKRCEKETGEDWPRIARIPYLRVQAKSEY